MRYNTRRNGVTMLFFFKNFLRMKSKKYYRAEVDPPEYHAAFAFNKCRACLAQLFFSDSCTIKLSDANQKLFLTVHPACEIRAEKRTKGSSNFDRFLDRSPRCLPVCLGE